MNENAQSNVTGRILRHIADHEDDEVLRELATEVIRGNVQLADAMSISAYSDALTPKVESFMRWYDRLSDDERTTHADKCAAQLEALERRLSTDDAGR